MSGAARVGRNALVTGLASIVVRFSGLFREIVFAAVFGAGVATAAYNAAFRAAQFFRDIVAEGSLSNAFVPIFAETEAKEGTAEAWRLANAFLGLLLLVLGGISLLTFALARGWVFLIASGFAEDPGKLDLAVRLTRIMSPFVAAMSLAALFMGMLNVRGRFFLPSVTPAIFNFAVIAGSLLGDRFEALTGQPPIVGVALASMAGGGLQVAVQLPALFREGFRLRPSLAGHPGLRRLVKFLIPAFIGLITVQFNLAVESQIASRFGDGPVSYLFYSFRLVQLPASIVAVSVATAALVGISTHAARDERGPLREAVRAALTLNSFLVVPAAVGMYLLAQPIVALAFERGAFTPTDTAATAVMVQMYAIATWGICAHRVTFPCYYALGQPIFPMKVAIALMLLKLPVAWAIVWPLGMGYQGLPLSHAVLVTAETVILWAGLSPRVGGLPPRLVGDHFRIAVGAVAMGVAVWALRPWAHGAGLVAVCAGGALIYFGVTAILGMEEPRTVLRRLLGPRGRGLPPTVDPETAAALRSIAAGPVALELAEGVLVVQTAGGTYCFEARAGLLSASRTGEGAGEAAAVEVGAVMRIGGGPPMLHGLQIGGRSFRAVDAVVEEGRAPGPVVPVSP